MVPPASHNHTLRKGLTDLFWRLVHRWHQPTHQSWSNRAGAWARGAGRNQRGIACDLNRDRLKVKLIIHHVN
jgi:hypothetical protein